MGVALLNCQNDNSYTERGSRKAFVFCFKRSYEELVWVLIFKCINEAFWLWEMVSGTLPVNNAVS